jgi:hypothetical protein
MKIVKDTTLQKVVSLTEQEISQAVTEFINKKRVEESLDPLIVNERLDSLQFGRSGKVKSWEAKFVYDPFDPGDGPKFKYYALVWPRSTSDDSDSAATSVAIYSDEKLSYDDLEDMVRDVTEDPRKARIYDPEDAEDLKVINKKLKTADKVMNCSKFPINE